MSRFWCVLLLLSLGLLIGAMIQDARSENTRALVFSGLCVVISLAGSALERAIDERREKARNHANCAPAQKLLTPDP